MQDIFHDMLIQDRWRTDPPVFAAVGTRSWETLVMTGSRTTLGAIRATLRDSRLFILFELAVLAATFVADELGYIFFTKTLYLLAFAAAMFWLRGARWRDVGFCLPAGWLRLIVIGLIAGLAMSAMELFVTQPILVRLTGEYPDLELFRPAVGNLGLLLLLVLGSWTIAAFGEELVYRGWVLNRLNDLFGRTKAGAVAALVAMTAIFAVAHGYQGFTGVAENAVAALLLGSLYFATGRNLIAPIVAHGLIDTIDFTLIYFAMYPGM